MREREKNEKEESFLRTPPNEDQTFLQDVNAIVLNIMDHQTENFPFVSFVSFVSFVKTILLMIRTPF